MQVSGRLEHFIIFVITAAPRPNFGQRSGYIFKVPGSIPETGHVDKFPP